MLANQFTEPGNCVMGIGMLMPAMEVVGGGEGVEAAVVVMVVVEDREGLVLK